MTVQQQLFVLFLRQKAMDKNQSAFERMQLNKIHEDVFVQLREFMVGNLD